MNIHIFIYLVQYFPRRCFQLENEVSQNTIFNVYISKYIGVYDYEKFKNNLGDFDDFDDFDDFNDFDDFDDLNLEMNLDLQCDTG